MLAAGGEVEWGSGGVGRRWGGGTPTGVGKGAEGVGRLQGGGGGEVEGGLQVGWRGGKSY